MNYTTLSLTEVEAALQTIARNTEATFGQLNGAQLNWRPDARRWSVAQCLQHLLTANDLVLRAAEHALENPPSTVWQRLPLLPGLMGRALIRSQAPGRGRQYTAPVKAQPMNDIDADIIDRFVRQQRTAAEWTRTIEQRTAARCIMISPFIRWVAYSVLDGCRLIVAHDHRHFEQARRVTLSARFPSEISSEVT